MRPTARNSCRRCLAVIASRIGSLARYLFLDFVAKQFADCLGVLSGEFQARVGFRAKGSASVQHDKLCVVEHNPRANDILWQLRCQRLWVYGVANGVIELLVTSTLTRRRISLVMSEYWPPRSACASPISTASMESSARLSVTGISIENGWVPSLFLIGLPGHVDTTGTFVLMGPMLFDLPLDLGVWNRVLAAVPYVHVTISVKYCRSVSEGQLCVRQGNDRIVGAVTPAVVFRQVCAGDELRNFSLYVAQVRNRLNQNGRNLQADIGTKVNLNRD